MKKNKKTTAPPQQDGGTERITEIYSGPANMDSMPQVMKKTEKCLIEGKISRVNRAKLLVAVDELYSNICRHSGAKKAAICCRLQGKDAKIILEDDGRPYDPLQQTEPDISLSAEARQIGGLGIYLIRRTMDEVQYKYEDGLNKLTILKKNHALK